MRIVDGSGGKEGSEEGCSGRKGDAAGKEKRAKVLVNDCL